MTRCENLKEFLLRHDIGIGLGAIALVALIFYLFYFPAAVKLMAITAVALLGGLAVVIAGMTVVFAFRTLIRSNK